jgi:spore coat protein U-like protein
MVRTEIGAALLAVGLLPCFCGPAQALLFCGGPLSSGVIVSATPLSFGAYTPASPSQASADVTVRCGVLGIDLLPGFTVSLVSANSANPAARHLDSGAAHLNYNIYTGAGHMTVWGDGTGGSITRSYNSLLALGTISLTGFGLVPGGQYVPAGSYGDVITVLIAY